MLRLSIVSVLLIDVGLVAARLVTHPDVFILPSFNGTIGLVALSFSAAAIIMIGSAFSKVFSGSVRTATSLGVIGGVLMIVHMALENFGSHVGEDWRLTLAVMFTVFALWFSSGWRTFRNHSALIVGAVAGCWTALVSVILVVTLGFVGTFFDMPSSAYVATWPEYIQSGSSDPQAFAIANTLDAATSHLIVALIFGPILGGAGWLIASAARAVPSLKE